MIDTNSLKMKIYKCTDKWQDLRLYAKDTNTNKSVLVAFYSFNEKIQSWIGSKKRAFFNIVHLKNFLKKNNITDLNKWLELPDWIRFKYSISEFDSYCPCFNSDCKTHLLLYRKKY